VLPAASSIQRPPGPQNQFPLLGVFPRFRKDPPKYLLEMARQYGDLVHLRLANQHAYIVSHPDAIRDVLVTNQSNFKKSRILERARVLLGEGLLTSEGEFHTRQRRLVQPAFHRDRLIRYAEDMVHCAVHAREQMQPGEQDIWHAMTHLTLAIVGRTLFSSDISSDANQIGGALTEIFSLFDTLLMPFSEWLMKLPLPAMRKFERARAELDRVVYGLIADRRASGKDAGDLLSMLLLAQDSDGDGSGMSDKQVRDEALTLLLAGHETTANALSWCWHLLGQNSETEVRFHKEVDDVLAGKAPSFDDVPRLPYTTGVFAEALRLYPPAWAIGRKAIADYTIGEFVLPAESIVLTSPFVVHRDSRWFPEPEKFDPTRWQNDDAEKRPKFSYFPFGGGTRVCIGERFAWAEGVLVLATLAQKWRFRGVPDHPAVAQAVITLRPKYGIKMRAELR
jgi:cytochrome P450